MAIYGPYGKSGGGTKAQPAATTPHAISLHHFNGTNGAGTSSDEVGGVSWTHSGATLNTTSPKLGSASGNCANNTNYFLGSGWSDPGGGNWTWEFFSYHVVAADAEPHQLLNASDVQVGHITVNGAADTITAAISDITLSGAATIADGTWYHIALVRDGTGVRLYFNGVKIDEDTTANAGGPYVKIKYQGDSDVGPKVDEHRLSTGVRYTDNFTPTTTEFAVD